MHDLAVVDGVGNDVVECIGHQKPGDSSAQLLGDVVLLGESWAQLHHGNAHPPSLYCLVNKLTDGSLAKFASDVRFEAHRAQSSGLLFSEEGAGDDGSRHPDNEGDKEDDFHV